MSDEKPVRLSWWTWNAISLTMILALLTGMFGTTRERKVEAEVRAKLDSIYVACEAPRDDP